MFSRPQFLLALVGVKGPNERLAVLFGKRVKALREAKQWTQEQLATKAGLGPKHIGVIERGVKTSSFDAVEKLARALGVEYYQFFIPHPPRRMASIERDINALLNHPRRIDLHKVEEFLRGLRSLLRKLDKTGSSGQ